MRWFRWAPLAARLPVWLRTPAWRAMQHNPNTLKRIAGTVGITAVGMFGLGAGWGITIPFLTLNVVLGGIAEKLALVDGRIEAREFLCATISVDHDVVDGAPAARFASRFKELIESSYGLAEATA
jgi:pyruvate/2-oxoglutarate dehydrogenase complex dihydrolipoamide acyltransferase (E2) component